MDQFDHILLFCQISTVHPQKKPPLGQQIDVFLDLPWAQIKDYNFSCAPDRISSSTSAGLGGCGSIRQ